MSPSALAERIDDALLRARPLPVPKPGSKDERGAILVVAGSPRMPGAAILAAEAALRAGAGKLQIATGASAAVHVGAAVLEALVVPLPETSSGALTLGATHEIVARAERADAVVLGPGLVDETATAAVIRAVLEAIEAPVVVDAAALTCATDPAAFARCASRTVVTPHAGEMAAMLGEPRDAIEADPRRYATASAHRLGSVVVLKGATTYVAAPDGACFVNDDGDVGLATSGSGDVLAGVIGGLLARGTAPLDAAIWGVALHARAGAALGARIGMGFLAREISAEIPRLARELAS